MKKYQTIVAVAIFSSTNVALAGPEVSNSSLSGQWLYQHKGMKLLTTVNPDGTFKGVLTQVGSSSSFSKKGRYSIKGNVVTFSYKLQSYDLPLQNPKYYSGVAKDKMQFKNGNLVYTGVTIYFKSNDSNTKGVIHKGAPKPLIILKKVG